MFNNLKPPAQSINVPRLQPGENFEPFIVFLPLLCQVMSLVLCLLSRLDRYGEIYVCGKKNKQEVELWQLFVLIFWCFWTTTYNSAIAKVWLVIFIISNYSSMLTKHIFLVMKLF